MSRPLATVVGGGIAGLAAALALAQRGWPVRVIEQAPGLGEIGAGLQISPNGMAVLDALGVADTVARAAPAAKAVHLRDGLSGRRLTTLDLAQLRSGRPWCLVHRADLVAALAAGCRRAGVAFELDAKIGAVEVAGAAVTLRRTTGATEVGELVIGADGIRSVCRPAVAGATSARFTGQVAWRALVDIETPAAPEVALFLGPGRHLVAYPLRDARTLNLVAVEERRAWTGEGWVQPDDPAHLRGAFAGFAPELQSLLQRAGDVHVWGLFLHEVAPLWHRGRLALLGDAVHPTLPFLAQGACMALEDAWVLAAALDAAETPEEGFAVYQATRRPRCVRAVAAARRNARLYHLRGSGRWAAQTALRLADRVAPGAALARFDWLYGTDVTRD